ncbi:hypothetical protein D3C71_156860 [compost metagenome]
MKSFAKIASLAVAMTMLGCGHALAEKCYEEQAPALSLECANGGGRSADFTGSCQDAQEAVIVEVDCPARWYSVPQLKAAMTQSAFCATKGLSAGSIDGAICASVDNRPHPSEPGAAEINYWSTDKLRNGVKGGGTSTATRPIRHLGDDDGPVVGYTRYCLKGGEVQPYDNFPDLLVAWVCQ